MFLVANATPIRRLQSRRFADLKQGIPRAFPRDFLALYGGNVPDAERARCGHGKRRTIRSASALLRGGGESYSHKLICAPPPFASSSRRPFLFPLFLPSPLFRRSRSAAESAQIEFTCNEDTLCAGEIPVTVDGQMDTLDQSLSLSFSISFSRAHVLVTPNQGTQKRETQITDNMISPCNYSSKKSDLPMSFSSRFRSSSRRDDWINSIRP